jgi:AraC family transcriptional regulator of adaptative response/methylated-DNA-[protein]-cysteine methyltransferase
MKANALQKPLTATEQDPRWARIVAHDRSADGKFWFSVKTTKVYCRPSCASRGANPKNVAIHDTLASAKATGYRPCKRCKPDGPSPDAVSATVVAKATRLIEKSEKEPSLTELAKEVGLSPGHFHRIFKAATGLTPKGYITAHRAAEVRAKLGKSATVTDAMYDAGFNSSSRFYAKSKGMLGMTPGRFRSGGANEEIRFAVGQSSLGSILVASSAKGVVAVLIGEDPDKLARDLQDQFPKAQLVGGDAKYEALVAKVVGLVEAPAVGLDLPLDVRGTAFQERVWKALRSIPPGKTATYSQIARRIGAPNSMRAVAGACAANKLAVVIPCHRVVRNDGSLSGYAWGVERKKALIDREAASA